MITLSPVRNTHIEVKTESQEVVIEKGEKSVKKLQVPTV